MQNKNIQQYLNEFAVSFGPLSDQALTNKEHLVKDATYTPSPAKTKNVYKLHSFSTKCRYSYHTMAEVC